MSAIYPTGAMVNFEMINGAYRGGDLFEEKMFIEKVIFSLGLILNNKSI